MDSRELRRQAAKKLEEAKKILETAGDGALTEEQSTQIETLRTEAKGLQARAEQTESLSKELSDLDQPTDSNRTLGRAPVTGKLGVEDDPKRGFKTPRAFLLSVMQEGSRNEPKDERLQFLSSRRIALTAGSDEQGVYSDAYGGFLVPEAFQPGLLSLPFNENPVQGVREIPMERPTVSLNARVDKNHSSSVSGGLRVYRRGETQTPTASRMQFEQVKLETHTLMGLTYASEEILQDSPTSFIAILEAGFRDEFAAKMIEEYLNGTGAGQFEGINNCDCKIDIAKETDQDADTIVSENIINMRARAWRYGQCIWIANHDCLPQLMTLQIAIGTAGQLMWQQSLLEDKPDRLLGRPLILTEFCSTVGDVGDIILVNWSQYLFGRYQPLRSAESMHVRFLEHERAFKFWERNAGAPWWRSTYTPKRGSTMAPVIRLAERA